MIEVKLPNGDIAQFPDGMAQADIEAVLQRQFSAPQQASSDGTAVAPEGLRPGTPEYRDWAVAQARAGNALPQVSPHQTTESSVLDPFVQGVTFGWGDELRGVVQGGIAAAQGGDFGSVYDQVVDESRNALARERQVNPWGSLAAEVAGAIPTGMGLGGQLAGTGMNLGGRIVSGATVGAGQGLLYGAGASEAESPQGRALDGATGALVGGGIGAAVPIAGAAIGAGAKAVSNKVGPMINSAINPEGEAARRLGTAFLRDAQANPQSVMGQADELIAQQSGVPLMNVDRGGETVRALARSTANQSPEARQVITRAADDRFETQGLRAVDFIKRLTGGQADDLAYQDALKARAALTNAPRYKAAFSSPQAQAVFTVDLQELMQSPAVQRAITMTKGRGADLAAVAGTKPVQNPFRQGRDGTWRLVQRADGTLAVPNLEFWDQVKRNLDGMMGTALKSGDKTEYSVLKQIKDKLVGSLDAAVPQYQTARAGAAAFFGAEDALEAGKKFANQPRNVPEAKRAFAAFTDAEKQAFQTGYASELIDRIRSTRDRSNVINAVFGNQSSREMVELIFGAGKARQLEAYVRVENLADAIRGALGNSTTARQLMELGIGGGAGFALSGDWTGALTGAALARGGRWAGQKVDARVMEKLARLLTSSNPSDLQRAVANATMSQQWMLGLEALERALEAPTRGGIISAVNQ